MSAHFDLSCGARLYTETIKTFGDLFPMLTFFGITVYLMWSWTWSISISVLLWDVYYQWRRWSKSFILFKVTHSLLNISGARFDVCRTLDGPLNIWSLLPFIQFHPCTICSELFFDIVLIYCRIVSIDCPAKLHSGNREKLWICMDASLYSLLARCNEDYPGVSSIGVPLGKSILTWKFVLNDSVWKSIVFHQRESIWIIRKLSLDGSRLDFCNGWEKID